MSNAPRSTDPLQAVKDLTGDSSALIVLAGAAVSVLTSFIPFSPLIGGALVGWLVRDDKRRGATLGGVSGLLVSLPIGFIFLPVFGFAFIDFGVGSVVFLLLALVIAFFALLYTVGIGALGGYLGVRLYQDRVGTAATGRDRASHDAGRYDAGRQEADRSEDESSGWSDDRDDGWTDDRDDGWSNDDGRDSDRSRYSERDHGRDSERDHGRDSERDRDRDTRY